MANVENNNVDQTMAYDNQNLNNSTSESVESETIPSKEGKNGSSTIKSSILSGAAGAALGVVSTILTSSTILHDDNVDGDNDNHDHNSHQEEVKIDFATTVNDDMTFDEAFAAARQEVGPGGAFVWHGSDYGTYYGTEWNELTPEQQASFSQNAVAQQPLVEPVQTTTNQNGTEHNSQSSSQQSQQSHEETHEAQNEQQAEVVEVEVDGVYENVELEEGVVVNIGTATIDGHDAAFVDADQNGTFDIVAVDANDDGLFSDDEIAELDQNSGMTVDNFNAVLGQGSTDTVTDDIIADNGYSNDYNSSDLA